MEKKLWPGILMIVLSVTLALNTAYNIYLTNQLAIAQRNPPCLHQAR